MASSKDNHSALMGSSSQVVILLVTFSPNSNQVRGKPTQLVTWSVWLHWTQHCAFTCSQNALKNLDRDLPSLLLHTRRASCWSSKWQSNRVALSWAQDLQLSLLQAQPWFQSEASSLLYLRYLLVTPVWAIFTSSRFSLSFILFLIFL